MDVAAIALAAFAASLLTFFSGFGLGTILMPVMALFVPVPAAIAITAVVHLLSKVFKLLLLWRSVNTRLVRDFGITALVGAVPGALLLGHLSGLPALGSYWLLEGHYTVTPVKLVAGVLLIFFASAEWIPVLKYALFRRVGIAIGGFLSGFFGGLTGHQGAIRSAFLVQQSPSETGFVATNAAIAVMVDTVRIVVYGLAVQDALALDHSTLTIAAILAAWLGTVLGARLLRKTTMAFLQRLVASMMYALGLLLCAGFI